MVDGVDDIDFIGQQGLTMWVDKQASVTTEARERMSAIPSSTHAMQTSTHLVSVSVVTVGRNLERAQATAAKAEQALELAPDSVFILSNYDFKNPSHYKDSASAQGLKALYDGMRLVDHSCE